MMYMMRYMMNVERPIGICKADIRFRASCSICWHMLVMGDMIVVIICNGHYPVFLLLCLLVFQSEKENVTALP